VNRRERILLLASSLYDGLPAPATWRSNPLNYRSEPGRPSPSVKELCATCDGSGIVTDAFKRTQACTHCGGKGYRKIDPYTRDTGETVDEQILKSETRRVECDRCAGSGVWKHERCELCDGSGKRSVGRYVFKDVPEPDPDGWSEWDRAITRRNETGSYHELEVCLAELARRSLHLWRAFCAIYVAPQGKPFESPSEARIRAYSGLLGHQKTWVEQAILFLEAHMPREVRVPADVIANYRRDPTANLLHAKGRSAPIGLRDEEIRKRYREGQTPTAIIQETGLSKSRVYEIIYDEEVV